MIHEAIIITFPVEFLLDLAEPDRKHPYTQHTKNELAIEGLKECIRQIEYVKNNADENIWWHSIGTRPTQDVLYAYITILGKIRYRANVAGWYPGGEKEFNDGRKRSAKHWLCLSDFVAAPRDIERKGFQGFRYTNKLF